MEEQNKRKTLILTIIAVLTLLILIGGATYAYFQAQIGTGDKANVTVKAGTTDDLSFSLNDLDASKEKIVDNDRNTPILIEATQTNFAVGSNSIADGVTGTATLIANDENYSSSKTYNVYLNIKKNELQYTSYIKKEPDETPENILSFKDETKKLETDLSNYNPRPELYLTIKKNSTEVKTGVTINDKDLTYTSDVFIKGETTLGGFDITEIKGLIKIEVPATIVVEGNAEDYTETDRWEITVTFMNLDTDQHLNTGKGVVGEVLIQSEEYISQDIKNVNQLLADANKDGQITLYHHNGSIKYPNSIADLEDPEIVDTGYKVADNYKDEYSQIIDVLIKRSCNGQDINVDDDYYDYEYCYDEDDNDISKYYLAYKGNNTLYDTYKKALQQAIDDKYVEPDVIDASDDSYRFSGSDEDVKNYVCLDSKTTGECETDDDLYRIIGLFKNNQDEYEMKLIKAYGATTTELGDSAPTTGGGAYYGLYSSSYSSYKSYYKGSNWETLATYNWNKSNGTTSGNVNMWAESNLNKVNLNQFYYDYITKRATYLENHITEHTWTTGGTSNYGDAKAVYDSELGDGKVKVDDEVCYTQGNTSTKRKCTQEDIEYTAHIGLMYISDYMYGTIPSNWITAANTTTIGNNNWMYVGLYEWSISRYSSDGVSARGVDYAGYANSSYYVDYIAARPSFYLTSDAKINEGEGSKEVPYRITFE